MIRNMLKQLQNKQLSKIIIGNDKKFSSFRIALQ